MAQPPRSTELQPRQDIAPVDSIAADLTRAEIDQQIATAKRYPRSITSVQRRIEELATLDEETAAECIYELPARSGGDNKKITGPSIRFAEIVLQAWGNCRVAARVTNESRTHLEATGVYHDLETNMALSRSIAVRITKRDGNRYGDDMVGVASAAGTSKALRNAILAGVPKGVWRGAYAKAGDVARGTAATLTDRRAQALKALGALGAKPAEVFELLGVKSEADITLDNMLSLRGLYTALNTGEAQLADLLAAARAPKDKDPAPKRMAAPAEAEGFNRDHVRRETAKPEPEPDEVVVDGDGVIVGQATETIPPTPAGDNEQQEPEPDAPEGEEGRDDAPAAADEPDGSGDGVAGEGVDAGGAAGPGAQEDESEGLEVVGEIAAFLAELPGLDSWATAKRHLGALKKTDNWNEAEAEVQRKVHAEAGAFAMKMNVDPAADPTAFRCWVETADDPDTVAGTLSVLQASEAYAGMSDGNKGTIVAVAEAIMAGLRKGKGKAGKK